MLITKKKEEKKIVVEQMCWISKHGRKRCKTIEKEKNKN